MNIQVDGDNAFHTGWLARFLGLPKEHPKPPSDLDGGGDSYRRGFEDGWNTCNETPSEYRYEIYFNLLRSGQASVEWSYAEDQETKP